MKNFSKIFKPKSIAVVGASSKAGRVGNDILKNLIQSGFSGKIYPVNPKVDSLMGLKCYPSLKSINEEIDLMIIAVPAKIVLEIVEEGGKLDIPGAIIISSGFKEVGNLILEEKIKEICLKRNITLIGPNCLGVINPHHQLNASFVANFPKMGNIAFISQSGALCTAMIDLAKHYNLGFSKFISIGNKACVSEIELLEYLANDEETEIIAIYTEQLVNAHAFISIAKLLSLKNKALIVIKGGKSEEGLSASASHTGALAGDNNAYEALFNQANVIVAHKISELFDYLQIIKNNNLDNFNKLAIVTNAGGPGVLAVDTLKNSKLLLASLSADSLEILSKNLPFSASLGNPIDILGDANASRYKLVLDVLANDKKVDSVLFIFTPQSMSEIKETAQSLVNFKRCGKKISAVFMGQDLTSDTRNYLRLSNIASYSFPETAVQSLVVFSKWLKRRRSVKTENKVIRNVNKNLVASIINDAKDKELGALREDQSFQILSAYNISVVKNYFLKEKSQGLNQLNKFKNNLVLKIVSKDILHKTEVKGIKLNVAKLDFSSSYDNLIKTVKKNRHDAEISGVLLTEMIANDNMEMIVGAIRDPLLGPLIMVGFGGIYVEILEDKAFGVEPFNKQIALKMINSLKTVKILNGARGKDAYDKEAIADCLLKVRQLMSDFPEILELDINPLAVFKKGLGVKALDARILINYGK
jgi:acetate---CoA ligase (ADP-forming)